MIHKYEIENVLKKWSFNRFTSGIVKDNLNSFQNLAVNSFAYIPDGVKTIETKQPYVGNRYVSPEELETVSFESLNNEKAGFYRLFYRSYINNIWVLNPEMSPMDIILYVVSMYRKHQRNVLLDSFNLNLVEELKSIIIDLNNKRKQKELKPKLKTRTYINYGLKQKDFLGQMNKKKGEIKSALTLSRIQNFIDQQKDPHLLTRQFVSDSLTIEFGKGKGFSLRNIKAYWKEIIFIQEISPATPL